MEAVLHMQLFKGKLILTVSLLLLWFLFPISAELYCYLFTSQTATDRREKRGWVSKGSERMKARGGDFESV